ncbi:hypothetical protein V502_10227 [Pseudogymnoascus sp. VKM F-4520 (FW-2644)]|nr:hypothetical protein V502_10227 [Pseudogymnoascus sp. VKM F-4520 (FW-2644)]
MAKEVQVLEYLASGNSVHDGQSWVCEACDTFQIDVPGGSHTCLAYEPIGISLSERIDLQPGRRLENAPCENIKLDNIQEALPDDSAKILARLVEAECKEPGPQKIVNDRATIYTSRSLDYESGVVYPILTDLGMAMLGSAEYSHAIQAIPYRAPEVILGMKWNESVYIWNLGVVLLCGEHLFGRDNERDALALMIKYLGPPPVEFLKRSDVYLQYFDEQG